MKLYFQGRSKKGKTTLRLVAEGVSQDEVWHLIEKDLSRSDPYWADRMEYLRYWERDGEIKYDYGSHSQFYVLKAEGN